jgi:hypothetical protein
LRIVPQLLKNWKGKGSGLAGTSLRKSNDVFTFQCPWDRLFLDFGWVFEFELFTCITQSFNNSLKVLTYKLISTTTNMLASNSYTILTSSAKVVSSGFLVARSLDSTGLGLASGMVATRY